MTIENSTEAEIAAARMRATAAQRIDELLPKAIHAQRMAQLWENDYNGMRGVMASLLDVLAVPRGTKWSAEGGTIAVTVRAGNMDWEAAYKAIRAAYDELEALLPDGFLVDAILADAIKAPVPRKADSEPFLTVTPSKDVPPPIEQARREGRFEALRRVESYGLPSDAQAYVENVADGWGGWPEEETE